MPWRTSRNSVRRSPACPLTWMQPRTVCWNASDASTRPAAGTSRARCPARTGWRGASDGTWPPPARRYGWHARWVGCPPSTNRCAPPGYPTPRSARSLGWRPPRTKRSCWRWRLWQPGRSSSGCAEATEGYWTLKGRRRRRSVRYASGCWRGGWSSWSWCLSPTRRI